MRQLQFYEELKEKKEKQITPLWAATVLEGKKAGQKKLFQDEKAVSAFRENQEAPVFVEKLGQSPKLLICGGGHVSVPVIRMGKMLSFSVIVLEDRPKFADHARAAGADQVICAPFEETLKNWILDQDTYVVIVTRGHRYDEECLHAVLAGKTACAYVGMMGSRRRTMMVRNKMEQLGMERERIQSVHAPIGLAIQAQTPEEIAVSIMAEIIQVKNRDHRTQGYPEELMDAIFASVHKKEKAVLATIVSRQGSAPRETGTKMLMKEDGMTVGTIGGGCAESAVMQKALLMMRLEEQPDFILVDVDMTAREAEEEGMVCGGRIRVMLEKI